MKRNKAANAKATKSANDRNAMPAAAAAAAAATVTETADDASTALKNKARMATRTAADVLDANRAASDTLSEASDFVITTTHAEVHDAVIAELAESDPSRCACIMGHGRNRIQFSEQERKQIRQIAEAAPSGCCVIGDLQLNEWAQCSFCKKIDAFLQYTDGACDDRRTLEAFSKQQEQWLSWIGCDTRRALDSLCGKGRGNPIHRNGKQFDRACTASYVVSDNKAEGADPVSRPASRVLAISIARQYGTQNRHGKQKEHMRGKARALLVMQKLIIARHHNTS